MKELDLKLKLLAGKPIYVNKFGPVYPRKIGDIIEFGYTEYMSKLMFVLANITDLLPADSELRDIEEISNMNIMDFIYINRDNDMKDVFMNSLRNVLGRDDLIYHLSMNTVYVGDLGSDSYINKENFDEFKRVLQWQNGLKEAKEEKDFKPKNEKARLIAEKFKKGQKKVEEIKAKKSDGKTTFFDIISSVTAKSNTISKLNVCDLTLYQLYDEFKRIQHIDSYSISIQSLMAGVPSEKVKVQHWSSAID